MVIAWISDIGLNDPQRADFLMTCKKRFPQAEIYDFSGYLRPYDLVSAAYLILQIHPSMPDSSFILCDVKNASMLSAFKKPGQAAPDHSRHLIFNLNNKFLLTPDSGIIGLIHPDYQEPAGLIYYDHPSKNNFFVKDIYLDVIESIINHQQNQNISREDNYYQARIFKPVMRGDNIEARLLLMDGYGNLIFNFTRDDYDAWIGKRKFRIRLLGNTLSRIHESYEQVTPGNIFAIFNARGFLEIGIYGDSLEQKLFEGKFFRKEEFKIIITLES